MAKLSSSSRNALPKGKFAQPAKRAYPIQDKAHASNAKARATQQVKAGNLSPSQARQIDAAANKVLKSKGKSRGR